MCWDKVGNSEQHNGWNAWSKAPVYRIYHSHPFSKYSALVGAFWIKFTSVLYIFWLAIALQNVLQNISECWNLSYLTFPKMSRNQNLKGMFNLQQLKSWKRLYNTCVVSFNGSSFQVHLITLQAPTHVAQRVQHYAREWSAPTATVKTVWWLFQWPQGIVSTLRFNGELPLSLILWLLHMAPACFLQSDMFWCTDNI